MFSEEIEYALGHFFFLKYNLSLPALKQIPKSLLTTD